MTAPQVAVFRSNASRVTVAGALSVCHAGAAGMPPLISCFDAMGRLLAKTSPVTLFALAMCFLAAGCRDAEPVHTTASPVIFAVQSNEDSLAREMRENPDGSIEELRVGKIALNSRPIQVEVPQAVQRDQDFKVRVITYGGGCTKQGTTEASVKGRSAVITPYDWGVAKLRPNTFCTQPLVQYEHTATLRFGDAGTAQIHIRGRSEPSGEVIAGTYTVQVR